MRELLRSVARRNMKKAGVTRFNKKGKGERSFFAKNWREYLGHPVSKKKAPKKRRTWRSKFSPGYMGV